MYANIIHTSATEALDIRYSDLIYRSLVRQNVLHKSTAGLIKLPIYFILLEWN